MAFKRQRQKLLYIFNNIEENEVEVKDKVTVHMTYQAFAIKAKNRA